MEGIKFAMTSGVIDVPIRKIRVSPIYHVSVSITRIIAIERKKFVQNE